MGKTIKDIAKWNCTVFKNIKAPGRWVLVSKECKYYNSFKKNKKVWK